MDWIGLLAFRESFGLRLAAIRTLTLFLLGAAAGTNVKTRFCKPEQNSCCGSGADALQNKPPQSHVM
jgi:hypothetical protein